jgi:hypothetical protein
LGLTGYYRKFIRGYGVIVAPLTALLRKNSFKWSEDASNAFQALKHAVTHPSVLRLLDFTKPFTIECDASRLRICAILMQEGQPIAFMSQTLKGKAIFFSTYENELLSLVFAVQKWRPYLLGQYFIIKTDQQSLKFILEHKVGTVTQQRWMSKLLSYDFVIEYKKGKENKVADALSRVFEDSGLQEPTCSLISFPTPTLLQELKLSYSTDPETQTLLQQLKDGSNVPKGFTLQHELILKNGRIYIVKTSPFKEKILHCIHSNPQAGHSGYHKTMQRVKADFYW